MKDACDTDLWRENRNLLTKGERSRVINASTELGHELLALFVAKRKKKLEERAAVRSTTVNIDVRSCERLKALVPGFNLSQWIRSAMVLAIAEFERKEISDCVYE